MNTGCVRWRPFAANTTPGQMTLNPDFKEFVASLNAHKTRYLIVGGYAVAFHGHPRYTKDIDVWIERDRANAKRLMEALKAFGFGNVGLTVEDFLEADQVIQLGYPPNRIDLLTSLKGISFQQCYAEKVTVSIDDVKVHFIDLEHLKENKRAVGRHQDLADLEELK